MKRLKSRLLLLISGILLVVIGTSILFNPFTFFASNGTLLSQDPNLLSEIRAPGGMLMIAGLFITLAAVRPEFIQQALALSILIYGAYGSARVVSMGLDGRPVDSLVGATVIELAVSGLCFATWAANHNATLAEGA